MRDKERTLKRFKILIPVARAEPARAWEAELALTISAESEGQAISRAEIVLGPTWPTGLRRRLLRVAEVAA